MSYQVLARKSRPQDFDSLIGQEAIVTALRNALTEGRLAQAYLFSGIRGVGKTSAARVLAKALNCPNGSDAEPCNQCQVCTEITAGADLDVQEVDAATYSKVEQVRELTDSLRYGPARDRYKVVILDEVHRLSRQAFDALLKIIEEPPPHLVFIFATTEIEAVPATILSRCQEFHFRRVSVAVLAAHLRRLCDAEGIEASDNALRLIARAGEGSVRDSVALLDQLATFGAGTIADQDAGRLLGGLDGALFQKLLQAMLGGDAAAVSGLVRQMEEEGRDPRHLNNQFLSYCRDALHLALGGDPETQELPVDDATALAEIARPAGYENLLRLMQQLLASEASVRRSEAGILALEIAWLRATELPKLTRIEEVLRGVPPTSAPPAGTGGGARRTGGGAGHTRNAAPPAEAKPADRRPEPRESAPPETPSPPVPAPPTPAAAHSAEPPPRKVLPEEPPVPIPDEPPARAASSTEEPPPWVATDVPPPEEPGSQPQTSSPPATVDGFLEEVARSKLSLSARLAEAEVRFADHQLTLRIDAANSSLLRALDRASNREVIDRAVQAAFGAGARWRCEKVASADYQEEKKSSPSPAESSLVAEVTANPTVQAVLDIFGGTVESIEKHQ